MPNRAAGDATVPGGPGGQRFRHGPHSPFVLFSSSRAITPMAQATRPPMVRVQEPPAAEPALVHAPAARDPSPSLAQWVCSPALSLGDEVSLKEAAEVNRRMRLVVEELASRSAFRPPPALPAEVSLHEAAVLTCRMSLAAAGPGSVLALLDLHPEIRRWRPEVADSLRAAALVAQRRFEEAGRVAIGLAAPAPAAPGTPSPRAANQPRPGQPRLT